MNEVLKAISGRRSIRGYRDEQITQQELETLMRAAVESPSARNQQPWHFSFVQDRELIARVNREADPNRDIFYNAPTVVFISADPSGHYTPIDCGIAAQTLALAAYSMGLGSVILGYPRLAFQKPEADSLRHALGFPQGHDFMIAVAVGYGTVTKEAHPVEPNRVSVIK